MTGNGHWRRVAIWLLSSSVAILALPAGAVTRAWLDRDSIDAGDAVTLNIETDQRGAEPDYSPLRGGFGLGAKNANQQMQVTNGSVTIRALFGVVITPRQTGEIIVPAIRVGNERTEPLRLQVVATAVDAGAPGAAGASAARGNEEAFVETQVDDPQPYVQQSVGVVVRLYYATQLASGELDLQAPDGASLQRVGDDVSSARAVNGRQYNVVERRYLLVPERSGRLVVPPARFNGRAVGGFFDDYFGRGNGELNARSASIPLQVRAQPANAPQPWLPLRSLTLRYTSTPQRATAGEAAQIVVEASARGATQAQFPELPTPSVPDAQVFAEPAQYEERFVDGSPQLRLTRRYSIVPNRAGPLLIPGLQVAWWDVGAAAAKTASLPDLTLDVAAGSGAFAAPAAAPSPASQPAGEAVAPAPAASTLRLQGAPAASRPWGWIAAAAGFAVLWIATLVWALRRRRGGTRTVAAGAGAGAGAAAPAPGKRATHSVADLRRALDTGGMDDVATVLCGMAGVVDIDSVLAALSDPAQRAAVAQMQRARWGGDGDVTAARAALREAFANGPRWHHATAAEPEVLAPLYPPAR
ncbi:MULTISPECIES: BatD family protein [Xanthomonas]|uniref:BatD family protein n=1 Tax=Xanthomonas TaxID=338 RepID=UPI00096EC60D|nr:BatD family protein [Xanthomonas campestris]MCC5094183.1 BatD family protein [Xanthomonas campestris pv. incanae]MEA9609985.1 BatD family protein [Xanthomonas campestris pv. incanae]MEA9620775.1 BatD family protein [Xanthomonas campestris pv. incanae]RFF47122.1 protein BatD [Xanthomonas campestris pv. incanae]WDJ09213.1 BatD family protein [Xanthomonas campestris pv. incanae]